MRFFCLGEKSTNLRCRCLLFLLKRSLDVVQPCLCGVDFVKDVRRRAGVSVLSPAAESWPMGDTSLAAGGGGLLRLWPAAGKAVWSFAVACSAGVAL